ncbi:MAG TPA: nodulation protein NfeD [Bryobacteraceae bacterium]|nr:nodulation protein NfeD [Bryobacteraceae bacterium]
MPQRTRLDPTDGTEDYPEYGVNPVRTVALCLAMFAGVLDAAPKVIAVDVDSVIHPITAEEIGNAINRAGVENAAAVLLRLNTPGGLLDATRDITSKIVASRVPVIAYVGPSGARAASAGFFILVSSDVAAMASGTNTGASSPVLMGEQMDPVMRNKVENDTAAWLRSMVEKRGRNVELAETTIRKASSFTEVEALRDHLIDLIEPDEAALLNSLDGREITRFDGRKEVLHTAGAAVTNYQPSMRERIIAAVADPNVAFILLVLGALGIYVEFTSPGLIFPGVAGGILALLGLSGLAVLSINWVGAALLALGAAMFILEAKYTSHGVLGVGGAVSVVLGALLLVNGPPEMRIRLSTALSVAIPFALITMFLVSLVVKARASKALLSDGGMMNEIGEARTTLDPSGKVFVHGEYWDAVSPVPLEAGRQVRVVGIEGMKLRVEPASKNSS